MLKSSQMGSKSSFLQTSEAPPGSVGPDRPPGPAHCGPVRTSSAVWAYSPLGHVVPCGSVRPERGEERGTCGCRCGSVVGPCGCPVVVVVPCGCWGASGCPCGRRMARAAAAVAYTPLGYPYCMPVQWSGVQRQPAWLLGFGPVQIPATISGHFERRK